MLYLSLHPAAIVVICILAVLVLYAVIRSVVIVKQTEAYIVERVGKYRATLDEDTGLLIYTSYSNP